MRFLTAPLVACLFAALPALAADPNPAAEAKLRETLRSTMLQLRTIQGERDALQAGKAQLEAEKKAAEDQVAALQKQLAADKEFSDKAIAELKEKGIAQFEQISEVKASLDKWKAAHAEVTAVAQKKEAERAALAQQKIELDRKVADQQTRNLGMYRVGSEILSRYEKFGLGTALSAREPFTGTMRVKLENLVQDYGDKLSEQRIKPEPASERPATKQSPKPRERPAKPAGEKPRPSRRDAVTG